jgi:hypothetical protein
MESKVFDFIESLSGSYKERYKVAAAVFNIEYEEAENLWFFGFFNSRKGAAFKKLLQDIDFIPEDELREDLPDEQTAFM